MKNKIHLPIIIIIYLFIQSCSSSSPEAESTELANKFCKCLEGAKTLKKTNEIQNLVDKCKADQKSELDNYKNKYKDQQEKWNLFMKNYDQITYNSLNEINGLIKKANEEYSAQIATKLSGKWWVNKNEKKGYHLYNFEKTALVIMNCRGEGKYQIYGDTLIFEDTEKTKALISTPSDNELVLTDCKTSKKCTLNLSTEEKDKLLGSWSVKGGFSVAFYPSGSCTVKEGWSTSNTKYSLNNSSLNIDGAGNYKISLAKNDFFMWGQAQFSRNKSNFPKNISVIF